VLHSCGGLEFFRAIQLYCPQRTLNKLPALNVSSEPIASTFCFFALRLLGYLCALNECTLAARLSAILEPTRAGEQASKQRRQLTSERGVSRNEKVACSRVPSAGAVGRSGKGSGSANGASDTSVWFKFCVHVV
jgi:hypothetical protein